MRFAIVCVNYNSYDSLSNYLLSIDKAIKKCESAIEVSVFIADNSTQKELINLEDYHSFHVYKYNYDNIGYLGGAFAVINSIGKKERREYDYYAITNVDVTLEEDFFDNLLNMELPYNIAWIAPRIFVTSLQKVGDFEIEHRPSALKMRFYNLLYCSVLFFKLYYYLSRVWIRTTNNNKIIPQEIYSGYGSFMIFSSEFINSIEIWDYPPFLFGEEIFFAERARLLGMKVYYCPNLTINDIGKVSTGKIASRKKMRMQRESNHYLYKEFFRVKK